MGVAAGAGWSACSLRCRLSLQDPLLQRVHSAAGGAGSGTPLALCCCCCRPRLLFPGPPPPPCCCQVELAGERVQRELEAAFLPLLAAHKAGGEPTKLRPSIAFDVANNALWVKIPKNSGKGRRGGGMRRGSVLAAPRAGCGMTEPRGAAPTACWAAQEVSHACNVPAPARSGLPKIDRAGPDPPARPQWQGGRCSEGRQPTGAAARQARRLETARCHE